MRVSEAVDEEGRVENRSVIFGTKACAVGVAGLGSGAVDAVDVGGDLGGRGAIVGGGAAERSGAEGLHC